MIALMNIVPAVMLLTWSPGPTRSCLAAVWPVPAVSAPAASPEGLAHSGWAAEALGALAALLALAWLLRSAVRKAPDWRRRWATRGVRARRLAHRVLCHDGNEQADGRVYSDSQVVIFEAEISLPRGRDIYPLHLGLQLVRPDGSVWGTLPATIGLCRDGEADVLFRLEQVGELLACPGAWRLRLVLRNTGRRLVTGTLAVADRAQLIADLEASNVRLLAVRDDNVAPQTVITTDVAEIVPVATIRPKTLDPTKFRDMRVTIELLRPDRPGEVVSATLPLDLSGGAMELCAVSWPVARGDVSSRTGKWELRLSVEGRELARLPFLIAGSDEIAASFVAERFDLVGIRPDGNPVPVGPMLHAGECKSLCAIVRVGSKLPLGGMDANIAMDVTVGDARACSATGRIVLGRSPSDVVMGEFILPPLPRGGADVTMTFALAAEGRELARRKLVIRRAARCADPEGRIVAPDANDGTDYNQVAADILRQAAAG